ncbi:MAG: helix-turn-helix transcriptional regulator [Dyadobacter sp.]|uniref:helix-turn-helix domain-containing protein n=1 Tax=Dyadobacter sp. TaxID=1914288 RepID=UPI003267EA66
MENTVNERVAELISVLNLTHNSFAKSISKTATTIYQVTSGKNKPGFDVLEAICEVHNVNSNWLVRGEGEMFLGSLPKSSAQQGRPDSYLQEQIERLEANFNSLANQLRSQLEVKDNQIQNLSEMLKMTLGKSDLSEETPCYELNSLLKLRA